MTDLRQEQIDRLNARLEYLDKQSAKAIADKKAQVDASLTKVPERYEKQEGKRSPYELLTSMKAALDRDGEKWCELEKQRLTAQKELQETIQSNRNEFESWLEGKDSR